MSDTTFYVYHSDGSLSQVTPFESAVQTLIPALEAEQSGASTVIEVDPNVSPILDGHTAYSFPAVVAVRQGRQLASLNPELESELDPPTLLDPGGLFAEDTLDAAETADQSAEDREGQEEISSTGGEIDLKRAGDDLLQGDILTSESKDAVLANLIRAATDQPLVRASKYVSEEELPFESYTTDMDEVDSVGTGGSSDPQAVQHAAFQGEDGLMRRVAGRSYELLRTNFSSLVAPTVNDDADAGYSIGSRWIDQTAGVEYVAADVTPGAASWIGLGSPGGGEANVNANVGAGAGISRNKTGVTNNLRSITTPDDHLRANLSGDDLEVELSFGDGATIGALANVDESANNPTEGHVLVAIDCGPEGMVWKPLPLGGGGGCGGGGEANGGANVGGGAEIFKGKVGVDLQMKTLISSDASVTFSELSNTLDIKSVGGVFGQAYVSNVSDDDESTTSGTWVQHNQITLVAPAAGVYRIEWNLLVNNTVLIGDIRWRIQLNNSVNLVDTNNQGFGASEAIDAGGDQRFPVSGFIDVALAAGNHEIDYDFSQGGAGTAFVYYSALAAYRVA